MTKRPRQPAEPEELEVGTAVIYWPDNKRGVVTDAFAPIDQFWVKDTASGEMVRQMDGEIKTFGSAELEMDHGGPLTPAAAQTGAMPAAKLRNLGPQADPQKVAGGMATLPARGQVPASARVLVIGTEQQMLQIIQHFGPPDGGVRRDPQMLLAVPCSSCSCGPGCSRFDRAQLETCDRAHCPLLQLASSIDEGMFDLARALRPDIAEKISIRAYHLKQAMEQLGPDLRLLEDYYCLCAVTLPYGLEAIQASSGWQRHVMQEVRCQIDLGVTAEGETIDGEASLEATAQRVLGEACGIQFSDAIWEEEVQFRLRRLLNVDIPIKYWDGPDSKGFVIVLPADLKGVPDSGLLNFREPRDSWSGAALSNGGAAALGARRGGGGGNGAGAGTEMIGGKSVAQWRESQDQFQHLPRLPEGWIRIKSRNNEEVYFYNTKTHTSTFELPLPEGWTKQKSKSSGKVYYFNAKKRKSMYEIPTENS